jgi:hypothetical protein
MSNIVVPDVAGEIVGYRAWQITGTKKFPLLASVTYSSQWKPWTWTVATCDRTSGPETSCSESHDGRVPGELCTCGMYAANSMEQLLGLGYASYDLNRPIVVGEVGFAGKVIPGTQGWRAEKGRVRKLWIPPPFWKLVEPLKVIYHGLEVVLEDPTGQTDERWAEYERLSHGDRA